MDYTMLGLGPATSLVAGIQIAGWGSTVRISCIYNPQHSSRPYELCFEDCRRMEWDVHEVETIDFDSVELIGLVLGRERHAEPAIITTDVFELRLTYGSFRLVKNW